MIINWDTPHALDLGFPHALDEVRTTTEWTQAALPTDPASIFIYVLLIVVAGALLWANRRSSGRDEPAKEDDGKQP